MASSEETNGDRRRKIKLLGERKLIKTQEDKHHEVVVVRKSAYAHCIVGRVALYNNYGLWFVLGLAICGMKFY